MSRYPSFWMDSHLDIARAARWLRAHGYRIGWRDGGFRECLIESGDERWKGVGRTRRSAFRHALARAFPSRAARDLLTAAVESWTAGPADAHSRPSTASSSPTAAPRAFRRVDAAFVLPHETTAPPGASFVPSPPTRRVVKQIQVDDALDQFDELERSLRASLDTASVLCAPRQKLLLLSWVALARHIEESAGGIREAQLRAKRIKDWARNLSKVWWPGTLRALDPNAAPADSSVDLPNDTPRALENWSDVANAAEDALVRMEADDEARGFDSDGWKDAAHLEPGPSDPKGMLNEVVAHLEAATAPLSLPNDAGEGAQWLIEWTKRPVVKATPALEWGGLVSRLRWLRGHTDESQRWSAAVGRLRCIADRLKAYERDDVLRLLDRELDIGRSWARHLGFDPERKAQQRRRKELLSNAPVHAWSDEQILQWIQDAIALKDLMTSQRIAEALVPVRDRIRAFVADVVPGFGRRGRARLRDIQEALDTTGFALRETTRVEEPTVDIDVATEEASEAHDRVLLAAVHAHTRGRRALVVSNRNDPELDEQIKKLLQLDTVDHGQIEPRRLEALSERVEGGRYDFVLAATGFMPHKADGLLRKAAQKSEIHYVRMNRGRPRACLAHLARELGIAPHSP
jgi:hypothetical protein